MNTTFELVSTADDLHRQLFVGTRQQCVSKLADLLETAYSQNRIVTRLPPSPHSSTRIRSLTTAGCLRHRYSIKADRPNGASYTLHIQQNH